MDMLVMTDRALVEGLLERPVSGLVFGLNAFSQRMRETFSAEELAEYAKRVHEAGKKFYVNMNALIEEEDLDALEDVVRTVAELPLDGVLFADLAVYEAFKPYNLTQKLIYYPETYVTSPADVDFWSEQDIQSVVLSRELTLASIEKIGQRKNMPIAMVGHGYLNMFHSKRRLVKTFFDHTKDQDSNALKGKTFTLVEELRDDLYPIYQDDFGTHIFRSRPFASFKVLDRLAGVLDVFLIDTLFYERDRIFQIVDDYAFSLEKAPASKLLERYEDHDDGFLFQETTDVKARGGSR